MAVASPPHEPTSRDRLIDAGRELFWRRGFHDVGLNQILKTAEVPKGSFYHHFDSKEAFGQRVVEDFADESLAVLDAALAGDGPPLEKLRGFFEGQREFYEANGCCNGCLVGNVGQELAETSDVLRRTVELHFARVRARLAGCLGEAARRGDLADGVDIELFADVLFSAWHGALLRMKVEKSLKPIDAFLDFHLPRPS
ncbi:MAG: TetR family transcriptional regulator C-terminal domain-containing protein [Acidobacteriota bacterium]